MKYKAAFVFSIAVLAGMLVLIGALAVPIGGQTGHTVYIEIDRGESLNRIASKLENKNLIFSKSLFKWAAIVLGNRKSIKSGEYEITGQFSTYALIRLLSRGTTILKKITIPEGLSMDEVFAHFEEVGLGTQKEYLQYGSENTFIQSLGLGHQIHSLEGFLFPETYLFSKNTAPQTVIRVMVRTFFSNIPEDYGTRAKAVGLTYYEAIILASIIEKETGVSAERKLIASVFHNRLRTGMRLQTDPTVIYGIKDFNGNLTREQLRTRTPYNTYMVKGLPPTPIANPGLESLLAAVHPAATDYLYFVAKGDGTHKFTNNYRDHDHAVTKYQKQRTQNYKSF
ncbi:endolytic transglycosylase MltG [bacterium]|nr:endolytic transglycosylase MltG [bacterium]